MIKLYTAGSPNTKKVTIALEELGCDYEQRRVNMPEKEQFQDWFLELSPNNKVPVIEDDKTGALIWESGAILHYLGEEYDLENIILPKDKLARHQALQWSFFQAAHIGPTLGRLSAQMRAQGDQKNPGMLDIFFNEAIRLSGALERALADGRAYLVGDYSIADIMHYPWLRYGLNSDFPILDGKPRTVDWLHRIAERPAVKRGMAALEKI